jgi:hypothetical protein
MSIRRWSMAALLAIGACSTLLVACSSSEDGEAKPACPTGQKMCGRFCESVTDPEYGCGLDTCERCRLEGAVPQCTEAGECVIESCLMRHYDCDGLASNGCEVGNTISSCGGCDIACPDAGAHAISPHCDAYGKCTQKCEPNYADADGDASNGCEAPVWTGSDENCPNFAPEADSSCDTDYWQSTICHYSHPEFECEKTYDCVIPLSVTNDAFWQQIKDCP